MFRLGGSTRDLNPRDWAVPQGLALLGDRDELTAAEERPLAARTARSDASSISRRIEATERNTPGFIGGGRGTDVFKRGGGDSD